ncbi:MAG: cyclic nucleotide-binding domain-containing protein [Bdellovibrionales bacterium]|nr:cyclic nucleotide-binding domain-containing protein [Bdellovibrionales bacterium]
MEQNKATKVEGTVIQYPAGTQVIGEDEISRKMYIIKNGQARVYKSYLGQKVTLAVLGAGEIFGELSFFDAEPRSASVEALSPLTVVAIDGEVATQQMATLPPWVVPIFKSVFHRFRRLDQEAMVLKHLYDFQKKHRNTDEMIQSIYRELLRFIRAVLLLYNNELKANGQVHAKQFRGELQGVLGESIITVQSFWKAMTLHDFIDSHEFEQNDLVHVRVEPLKQFEDYLSHQIDEETFLLLSRTALLILKKMAGHIHAKNPEMEGQDKVVALLTNKLDLKSLSLVEESMTELKKHKLIQYEENFETVRVRPALVFRILAYQGVIKAFDHSILLFED